MTDTLNITGLGRLEIVETYVYYDQPVLFSCKSATGHLYLAVATDKNDERETWLYVGVSVDRLNLIRSGAIDLHAAFAEPEDGFLLQEIIPYNNQTQPRLESIQPDQISEDMLPVPGECLDLESETLPMLSNVEEIVRIKDQDILDLTINFAEGPKAGAPIGFLSNVFGELQDVVNTIGMICFNSNQITEKIRESMKISLLQVGAGSFNIRLALPKASQLDFFNSSDCEKAIEIFFELLNAKSNNGELKKLVGQLKLRVAKNYTKFLKSLSESVSDTRFTWKSPNPERGGSVYLSKPQIQLVIEILEKFQEETPLIFKVTGKLTGAFLSNKTFEIETTDRPYKGKITDQAIETVRNATLSQIYTAEIQEITERSETTDETKTKYQLLSLRR